LQPWAASIEDARVIPKRAHDVDPARLRADLATTTATATTTSTAGLTTATTTTTTSTTTTTRPCTLDAGQTPAVCGGDCPGSQLCRDLASGDERVCAGVCPSPTEHCGQLEPGAPCTCAPPCNTLAAPLCGGGLCPVGQDCRADGGACACVPLVTTTTSPTTTSTTTTTSCPRLDVIASTQPPQITLGSSFDFEIPVTGGVAPITLQISSQGEPLPPGTSFDGRRVTGTPTATGVFQVLIEAFDSCPGGVQFDAEFFDFVINPSSR
jgi:hypothetical protein